MRIYPHYFLSIAGSLVCVFLVNCSIANAEGFRVLDQSASATGQGSAFTAQADDPAAVHYNPAGLTQLDGIQISAGSLFIGGKYSYKNSSGVSVTGGFDEAYATPPPSHFYISANLKDLGLEKFDRVAVGFGINSPFGLITNFPNDSPFSTVSTRSQLDLVNIKPVIAYEVNDWLSLGAGIDIYTFFNFLGDGQLELQLNSGPAFVPLGIPQGTPLEINGDDTAVGFNLSALFTLLRNSHEKPILNLGFVYRSQTTLNLEGEFLAGGAVVAQTSAELKLPQIFTGAIAYWPIRNNQNEWKLELDVDYADWSSFNNVDVDLSNGATIPFPQNWEGVFVTMLGTEYKWLSLESLPNWEVALRGGYINSQSPGPDSTFSPAVPDADYNAYSIGFGFLCKQGGTFLGFFNCGSNESALGFKSIGLDLAYHAFLYDARTIDDNINPVVNGTWDTIFHIGSASLRVNF